MDVPDPAATEPPIPAEVAARLGINPLGFVGGRQNKRWRGDEDERVGTAEPQRDVEPAVGAPRFDRVDAPRHLAVPAAAIVGGVPAAIATRAG